MREITLNHIFRYEQYALLQKIEMKDIFPWWYKSRVDGKWKNLFDEQYNLVPASLLASFKVVII